MCRLAAVLLQLFTAIGADLPAMGLVITVPSLVTGFPRPRRAQSSTT